MHLMIIQISNLRVRTMTQYMNKNLIIGSFLFITGYNVKNSDNFSVNIVNLAVLNQNKKSFIDFCFRSTGASISKYKV